MNDLLPVEQKDFKLTAAFWQAFEDTVGCWTRAYGYQQIRTPIVEQTGLFEEWADYPLFLCFGQFCVGFALCFLYGKYLILAKDFDFAGNHFVVGCAFRTVAYAAGNAQNVFVSGRVGSGKCFRSVGVDNDLNDAFAVAQVDKNHTAVVASAVYPAFDGNGLV